MAYTLSMFVLWAVLAAVLGGLVGWSLAAVGRRRSPVSHVDADEVDRLRRRVAELEAMVTTDGKDQRATAAGPHREDSTEPVPADPVPAGRAARPGVGDPARPGVGDPARPGVGDPARPGVGDPARPGVGDPARPGVIDPARSGVGDPAGPAPPTASEGDPADLDAASEILGERIRRDDLTAIRGLDGPLAELCGGIGVTTWQALAATPVDDLHSMLDAAGLTDDVPHLETWPRQAALLAAGDWVGFKALVDDLGTDR